MPTPLVYSEEDEVVGKFLMDNRIPVPYEKMPQTLVDAFVAAEDAEFFQHKGIDSEELPVRCSKT